jgi:hypothetical protein
MHLSKGNYMISKKMTLGHRTNVVPAIFNPNLPAWNVLTVGERSTGKKTIICEMILQEFLDTNKHKIRPKLNIYCEYMDIKEYAKKLQAIGPSIIEIDEKIKINPFNLEGQIKSVSEKKKLELYDLFSEDHNSKRFINDFFRDTISSRDNNEFIESIEYYLKDNCPKTFKKLGMFGMAAALSLKEGNCVPGNRILGLIMNFLEMILSKDQVSMDGFNQFAYDTILSVVMNTYERMDKYPTLSDIVETISKDNNLSKEVQSSLIQKMTPFLQSSFNTTDIFDLPNSVNIISFAKMPLHLKNVYTLFICSRVSNVNYHSPGMKICVYADSSMIHESERFKNYVIEDVRTARKHACSVILVIKSIDLLNRDDWGKAILLSCNQHIFTGYSESERNHSELYSRLMGINVSETMGLGVTKAFDKALKTTVPKKYKFLSMS